MLIKAGMDSKVAEAQAKAQAKIITGLMGDKLASKEDLKELKIEVIDRIDGLDKKLSGQISEIDNKLSGQIIELDNKLSSQITEVDTRLTGQIIELDNKLSGQITELDKRLSGQIAELDKKIISLGSELKSLESKMTVKLGSLMVLGIGVLVILLKLFHI